jgi:hypothetical protein
LVVSDNNNLVLDSSLPCNLSLPTSDTTVAKLPPQLKPPLLEAPVPTMPAAEIIRWHIGSLWRSQRETKSDYTDD